MTKIIGISGGFTHRIENPAATLIINGDVVFAQEEERFNRIKHSRGLIPTFAIQECLKYKNINIKEIDYIAFASNLPQLRNKISDYFNFNFGYCPKIVFIDHHLCHAASAFYPSGFKETIILTADYSGNGVSTTISIGKNNQINRIKEFKKPNSLGIFYSLITQVLGFEIDNDEYKLMGLASYGKPKYNLDKILEVGKGYYKLNQKIISKNEFKYSKDLTRQEPFYSKELLKILKIKKRLKKKDFTNKIDIAASAQKKLNDAAISLIKWAYEKTKISNLCIAGGVGLNCTMNKKISELSFIKNLYVQPASSDAGNSLGAALITSLKFDKRIKVKEHVYLGNQYNNKHIAKVLKNNGLYNKTIKLNEKFVAKKLCQSKIFAVFQGRQEFGPRALGNRSILANPMNKNMKNILNAKIKYREEFRPFAPIVMKKASTKYFKIKKGVDYRHMTVTCDAKPGISQLIPSCVHVDNTARVQLLEKGKNKLIENILNEFGKLSKNPVLINTSFNLNRQPNVNTPEDAISTFYASGIDYLIIGDRILLKNND